MVAHEPVEGESKGLILALTHWWPPPEGPRVPCSLVKHRQYISSTLLSPGFKPEIRVYTSLNAQLTPFSITRFESAISCQLSEYLRSSKCSRCLIVFNRRSVTNGETR